jgi:hypothetical protein
MSPEAFLDFFYFFFYFFFLLFFTFLAFLAHPMKYPFHHGVLVHHLIVVDLAKETVTDRK